MLNENVIIIFTHFIADREVLFSVLWEFSRFLPFFQLILWLTNKLLKSEKSNQAICFSSFKIFHFFTFTYKLKIKIKIYFKSNICSLSTICIGTLAMILKSLSNLFFSGEAS